MTKTANELYEEIKAVKQEKLTMLQKNGNMPREGSAKRRRYFELVDKEEELMRDWDYADRKEYQAKKAAAAV